MVSQKDKLREDAQFRILRLLHENPEMSQRELAKAVGSQPEKVRQVLDKVATDGLMTTVDAVRSKLGQPIPLGYCNVGVVRDAGAEGFKVGDRVVSNGPHADVVSVPRNLCATIPDSVSDEAASFTVVASIGLQGLRLAQPTLGEAFVVTGVGLIGLLTVQMLRAQGCRVLAIDFDAAKLELARGYGAETCNPGVLQRQQDHHHVGRRDAGDAAQGLGGSGTIPGYAGARSGPALRTFDLWLQLSPVEHLRRHRPGADAGAG